MATARIAIACVVLMLTCGPAPAQTERSGSSGNAQLMRQMQQLASERTQLQAENARLKQELDTLRKERDSKKSDSASAERKLLALQAAAARADQQQSASAAELAQQRARMEELVAKFRETASVLRDVETQRAAAAQSLATRDIELSQCKEHNQKLFALNGEILDYFDKRGFWSGLASAEPFTRLKRVELENLIGEYRAKAEDHSLVQQAP